MQNFSFKLSNIFIKKETPARLKGILSSFNKSVDCYIYKNDGLQLDTEKQLVVNDFTFIGKSFGIERTKLGKGTAPFFYYENYVN